MRLLAAPAVRTGMKRWVVVFLGLLAACTGPRDDIGHDAGVDAIAGARDGAVDGAVDGAAVDAAPDAPTVAPSPRLVAGGGHMCLLGSDGALRCWGPNPSGEIGTTTTETCSINSCTTRPLAVLAGVAAVAAGRNATCAIMADRTVRCFGDDAVHQLGFAGPDTCNGKACSLTPRVVPGLTGVAAMALGEFHTCALTMTGAVACAGLGTSGQLGLGTTASASAFTTAPGIAATALAVGRAHTCALRADHTVACWGDAQHGQLGGATTELCGGKACSTTPVVVAGLRDVSAIAAGDLSTCAVRSTGTVACWGAGPFGAETCGGSPCARTPVEIALTGVVEVAAGLEHTCARRGDGTVACWGSDAWLQLGYTSTASCQCSASPVEIAGVTAAATLAAGDVHTCALLDDGSGQCWGYNTDGEFGDGTKTTSATPVRVVW